MRIIEGRKIAELLNGESNDTFRPRPKGCSMNSFECWEHTSKGDCDGVSLGVNRLRDDGVKPLDVSGDPGAPAQPITQLNMSPDGRAGASFTFTVCTVGRGISAPVTL